MTPPLQLRSEQHHEMLSSTLLCTPLRNMAYDRYIGTSAHDSTKEGICSRQLVPRSRASTWGSFHTSALHDIAKVFLTFSTLRAIVNDIYYRIVAFFNRLRHPSYRNRDLPTACMHGATSYPSPCDHATCSGNGEIPVD